jgi:hypothetical protein
MRGLLFLTFGHIISIMDIKHKKIISRKVNSYNDSLRMVETLRRKLQSAEKDLQDARNSIVNEVQMAWAYDSDDVKLNYDTRSITMQFNPQLKNYSVTENGKIILKCFQGSPAELSIRLVKGDI